MSLLSYLGWPFQAAKHSVCLWFFKLSINLYALVAILVSHDSACIGSTDFTQILVIPPTCISLQVHALRDAQPKEEPNLMGMERTNANKGPQSAPVSFDFQIPNKELIFNSMLLSKNHSLIHEQINMSLMMFVYKVGNQRNCFGILRMLLPQIGGRSMIYNGLVTVKEDSKIVRSVLEYLN